MADLTRVAEVLAAHQRWATRSCVCGESLIVHGAGSDARDSSLAIHQTQMLAAAGLLPTGTETEWAADLDGDMRPTGGRTVDRGRLERTIETWMSRGNPRPRVLRREVTEWRTADEKRTSQPAQEATQAPAGRDDGAGTPANTSRVIPEAQGGAQ